MPPKIMIKYLSDIVKPYNVEYAAVTSEKFGDIQIATLNDAICFLYFAPPDQLKANMEDLVQRWKQATFHENPLQMQALTEIIFGNQDEQQEVEVLLCGTDFQNSVWETLLEIPEGEQWTYTDCAAKIGRPSAVRSVANAVAQNEVAYLIPCHRVLSKSSKKLKYRWGVERQKQLLDYEAGNKE